MYYVFHSHMYQITKSDYNESHSPENIIPIRKLFIATPNTVTMAYFY